MLTAARGGRVKLFPDPYDRCAIQVELTPLGRQIVEEHRLPDTAWTFTFLNGLEPRTMRSTAHVLHVLIRRLKRLEQIRATAPK